jgi:hypothetical protein
MQTGRRLKTWEKAGYIRRYGEAIIVTTSVTPTVSARNTLSEPSSDLCSWIPNSLYDVPL